MASNHEKLQYPPTQCPGLNLRRSLEERLQPMRRTRFSLGTVYPQDATVLVGSGSATSKTSTRSKSSWRKILHKLLKESGMHIRPTRLMGSGEAGTSGK